jgi:hypothetical protein
MHCGGSQVNVRAMLHNQSFQQTKPPVTSLADASAAPAVFAAEAGANLHWTVEGAVG